MKEIVRAYKKEFDYSYTSGAYATIELLNARPELVRTVYIHSDFNEPEKIEWLCMRNGIPAARDDIIFNRVNQKENSYVIGVFKKYSSSITRDAPHVALVNPSDMGNLGTIIRTLVGFNLRNLAIVTPAADIWHPKTVRASMGSLFQMNFEHFESFDDYHSIYPLHRLFAFMPDGTIELSHEECLKETLFTLVFGNEATGLDERFRAIGRSVKIAQSPFVDSLNLSVAVAVGTYAFAKANCLL